MKLFKRKQRKYKLSFWFEHGGACIWGADHYTSDKLGYNIDPNSLPLSDALKEKIDRMEDEFGTILDWSDPGAGYVCTDEHKQDFCKRANEVYEEIKEQLGPEYEVINEVERTVMIKNE